MDWIFHGITGIQTKREHHTSRQQQHNITCEERKTLKRKEDPSRPDTIFLYSRSFGETPRAMYKILSYRTDDFRLPKQTHTGTNILKAS